MLEIELPRKTSKKAQTELDKLERESFSFDNVPPITTAEMQAEVQTHTETKMSGFVVSLAGVKTNNVVDAGEYEVTFTEAKMRKSQAGNQTVNFTLTVTDEDAPEMKGRKVFTTYTLTPESLWAFKKDILILGADADSLEGDVDVMELCQTLYGQKALATVTVEPDRNDPTIERNRTKLSDIGLR